MTMNIYDAMATAMDNGLDADEIVFAMKEITDRVSADVHGVLRKGIENWVS